MGTPAQVVEQGLAQSIDRLRARRDLLQDEQRQGELTELNQTGGLTEEQRAQALRDLYAKNPSAFRQHVSNLVGKLVGRAPKPIVPSSQPQQDFQSILAQGTPLDQAQLAANQRALKWIQSLPPDQQRTASQLLGIRTTAKWVNIKNKATGETSIWDENSGEAPPPGYEIMGNLSGGGVTRSSGRALNPADAIALMKTGQAYPKSDGTNWTPQEIAQFPAGTVLSGFLGPSGIFYAPFNERTKTATIGNEVLQIPEVGSITPQTATPLGPSRVPTATTHQVPGMNPGEKITLTGTTTPQTTGMTQAQPQTPAAAAGQTLPPGPAPRKSAAPAKKGGASKKPTMTPGTPTAIGPAPPPFAPGTMLAQGRVAEPVVASMNTVAAQVFGQNGEQPIWSNAWMFDNPKLRTALNRALTLNALAIPGTEDDPSFTQTLATALGVTGWSQEQIQQANVQARQQLQQLGGDKALEMFARMAGLQEDLSALRSATKGSAAQGSIRTLVRAAPVYNVASSQNFRDQLGVTLNTAAASMSGYPAINPQYLEWWKKGAQAARGQGPAPRAQAQQPIVQRSKRTGQYRYSTDGGATWQPGQPPRNNPPAQ